MNEFRSVKQRDAARLYAAEPGCHQGLDRLCCAAFTMRSVAQIALCNSGQREAGFAFIIWESLRCNVIYLRSVLLPNIH